MAETGNERGFHDLSPEQAESLFLERYVQGRLPEFYHYRVLWAIIERMKAGDSWRSVAADFGADPKLVRAIFYGARPKETHG